MTRNDRWLVGAEDIRAVNWTCGKCGVAVSYPLDRTIRLPATCVSCGADGVDPQFRQEHRAFSNFVVALTDLRRAEKALGDAAPGRLQLEFAGEV